MVADIMAAMNEMTDSSLPNDVEQLKKLVLDMAAAHANEIEKKSQKINLLEESIRFLKHLKFGRSSERFCSSQHDLFNEVEELAELEAQQDNQEARSDKAVPQKRKVGKPRTPQQLPDSIARHEIFHDLPELEKICDCGCKMLKSGCQRSEQLNVVPPQFSVTVHVRQTYSCKACDDKLRTANKPPQAIEKSFASSSLLAYIIISKYFYALPLYRQEKIYESLNVPLKRNTMASWVIKGNNLIAPLLARFEYYLLRESYIQCDESRLQVLNEPGREAKQFSQMWVRRSMGEKPLILFDYASSRSGEEACKLLDGFSGYLQTDDYSGYNKAVKAGRLVQLGCNAHARRRFDEAKKSEPKNKKAKKGHALSGADIGLDFYKQLYAIERSIKTLSPEKRFQVRLEKSVPLFRKFVKWAEKRLITTPKNCKLGKALGYLVKNREKLIQYCGHERFNIDNNLAENAIRPFVLGRKNWLFSSSVDGAKASAGLYSLIETAKANGLNVFDYLKHLFEVLPGMKASDNIDALLPWNVILPE